MYPWLQDELVMMKCSIMVESMLVWYKGKCMVLIMMSKNLPIGINIVIRVQH